ncbi:MAG: hypothetical protein NXI32_04850 [bacterium]|nr:hypothetical protein [bacterium]
MKNHDKAVSLRAAIQTMFDCRAWIYPSDECPIGIEWALHADLHDGWHVRIGYGHTWDQHHTEHYAVSVTHPYEEAVDREYAPDANLGEMLMEIARIVPVAA